MSQHHCVMTAACFCTVSETSITGWRKWLLGRQRPNGL